MSLIFLSVFVLCVIIAIAYGLNKIGYSGYIIKWDFDADKYMVLETKCFGLAAYPVKKIGGCVMHFDTREEAQDYIEKVKPVKL